MFFETIDRDGDGVLSFEEYQKFYKDIIGIQKQDGLEKITKEGYRAMTAVSTSELYRHANPNPDRIGVCMSVSIFRISIPPPNRVPGPIMGFVIK